MNNNNNNWNHVHIAKTRTASNIAILPNQRNNYFKRNVLKYGLYLLVFLFFCLSNLCQALTENEAKIVFTSPSSSANQPNDLSHSDLELGQPKNQYFDTKALGFHRQNYAIKRGSDNRIYAVNRTGIIVYDGIAWDNITPYSKQYNTGFALGEEDKVYTVTSNDIGYYRGESDGQWKFFSLASSKQLPSFTGVMFVEYYQQHVVYLMNNYLFHYHPQQGMQWIGLEKLKFSALMLVNGEFYVKTSDKKVSIFSPESNQLKPVNIFDKLPNFNLKYAASSIDGRVLFASDEGLYLYDQTNVALKKIDRGLLDWYKNNQLRSLTVLSDGRILLGSKKKGIAVLDSQGNLQRFLSKQHGIKENWVSGITEDHNNDIWLSHGSQGISRVELDGISYYSSALGAEKLQTIARYNKQLFIGSLTQGLSVLTLASNIASQSRFEPVGNYSSVWSLMEHSDGLFVGHTDGLGLITQSEDGVIHNEKIIEASAIYEIFNPVSSPDILYGASSNGLLKIEKINGQWQSQGYLKDFSIALVTMTEDRYGKLWLTSHSGVIVRVNDLEKWPDSQFKQFKSPQLGDESNTLMQLDGSIFIVNKNGFFISDENGSINVSDITKQWPKNLNWIFHRHFRVGNKEVVTTDGERFFRIKKNKKGQFKFEQHFLERIRTEGLSAIFVDHKGTFWAGGSNGLVRVESGYLAQQPQMKIPQVHKVSSLQTETIYFSAASFGKNQPATPLTAQQRDLSIQFGTTEYRQADKLVYRYRLKGLMPNWSKWSKENRADFTNIPKGEFDFELQSKNDLGRLSETSHFSFYRSPFWYQTGWFYLVTTIIGLFFLIFIILYWARMRTKHLLRRAEVLEKTVEERTSTIAMQSKELERLNKVRTRFFTHVSHELRTPLTLTIGPLQEILDGQYGKVSNSIKQAMGLVLRSASSMQSLLNQVLDLSRMESGALSLKLKPIELVNELKLCSAPFELLAEKQQISFNKIYSQQSLNIEIDPKGLRSIVNNLLSNAFKFTSAGGIIQLELEVQSNDFIVQISDSGCGINEAELPYIFDQYYQAKSKQMKDYSGTGIGLSMVREYVELHGGNIQVVSLQDKGTTFQVKLPLIVSTEEPLTCPSATEFNQKEMPTAFNQQLVVNIKDDDCPTVLIVEDNEELRQFVARRLAERYRVLQAENGQQGLDLAAQQLPDVIITDVMMPIMDGHQLCKRLKSSKETECIPLVMLTSKGTGEEIVEGINLGADDYLAKPFSMPELLARVNRLIESRLTLRERYFKGELTPQTKANTEFGGQNKKSDDLVLRVKEIVLKQESEGFGVKELADALCMDRTTLYRKLKNATGNSVVEAIKTIRLEEAASLFRANRGNVTEVAYGVGFKSLGHFSRSFSAHFGQSPTEFIACLNL